jgi:hypothetical protein
VSDGENRAPEVEREIVADRLGVVQEDRTGQGTAQGRDDDVEPSLEIECREGGLLKIGAEQGVAREQLDAGIGNLSHDRGSRCLELLETTSHEQGCGAVAHERPSAGDPDLSRASEYDGGLSVQGANGQVLL